MLKKIIIRYIIVSKRWMELAYVCYYYLLLFIHNNTLEKWKHKNHDWNSNEMKQLFYCNSIVEFAKCDKEKERNKILSKLVNLTIK